MLDVYFFINLWNQLCRWSKLWRSQNFRRQPEEDGTDKDKMMVL